MDEQKSVFEAACEDQNAYLRRQRKMKSFVEDLVPGLEKMRAGKPLFSASAEMSLDLLLSTARLFLNQLSEQNSADT